MQTQRALVIGADGTIGGALYRRLAHAGWEVHGTTRRPRAERPHLLRLDLAEDPDAFAVPPNISIAWLLAAQTSQARVRADQVSTRRVNVQNTVALASRLSGHGAFLVFPSTSLVFDGALEKVPPGHPLAPASEYGRQKAEAERALIAAGDGIAIVRIAKVLHAQVPLIRNWIADLRAGRPISAFTDLVVSPVPLAFAVKALLRVGARRTSGIFQVSGAAEVTYFELARALARAIGAGAELVRPRPASADGLPAESLSRHATLDTRRLAEEFGMAAPSIAETVRSLIDGA